MNPIQTILITPGEPAGIGPDITLDVFQRDWNASLVVIADPDLLKQRAEQLNIPVKIIELQSLGESPDKYEINTIPVLPVRLSATVKCGQLDKNNSHYVVECLRLAEELCRTGQCNALVTAPVHKGIINDAAIDFSGHTEFLALPSNSKPVMMLATQSLRVALATTHLPLREVSDAITKELLITVISTLNHFLIEYCKLEKPNICVCGLNPHAGEDGHLGREELDTIMPAIQQCLQDGINVSNPMPADTAFTKNNLPRFDAVLAMYHDQGLPVLKHQGFGEAVNITLGLPFIRTSVDHGTALELAGTGKAKSSSLISAINMAIELTDKD